MHCTEISHAIRYARPIGGQRFRQLLRATWNDNDLWAKTLRLADASASRAESMHRLLDIPCRVDAMLRRPRRADRRSGTPP